MNSMRITSMLFFAAVSGTASADVTCRGQAGNAFSLDQQLDWCSRDHGFNEGAVCGANTLTNAGLSGVPAIAGGAILGNTWDRTNMMGAAVAASRTGQEDAAVNVAICCQIHNPDAHACLENNRAEVQRWLDAHH